MKKFSLRSSARILALLLVIATICCSPAYADSNLGAAELSAAEQALLYTRYQQIIDQANEEYGYSLSLVPMAEMGTFYSLTEFQQMVDNVCQLKATAKLETEVSYETPSSRREGTNGDGPWIGDVTFSFREYHDNNRVSATIIFKGTFVVRIRAENEYYIYGHMFHPVEVRTSSDELYYIYDGDMTITFQDSGRVKRITQAFFVSYYHSIIDQRSYTVFCWFNTQTGRVALTDII